MTDIPPPPPPPPDARSARADAQAAKARAKAMRPWYRKKRWWGLGAVVLLIVAIAASSSSNSGDVAGSDLSSNRENPPVADVEVTGCNVTSSIVTIPLRVTNHSSKASNYLVSLTITDSTGTKVGDGTASTSNVGAGQAATTDGFGTVSSGARGPFTCKVAEAERFAS